MLDAVRDLPEGHYAECGVWKGFMAEQIYAGMSQEATLFLFDTFAGHEEPHPEFDDAAHHPQGRYADTSWEEIHEKFPLATVVRGPVQRTLKYYEQNCLFRFAHIDMDHYAPTRFACEFFKPRMVKGGIIRFDDYNFNECPGATKAVDEIFGRENILPSDYRFLQT